MRKEILCYTISNNAIPIITITNYPNNKNDLSE